MARRHGHRHPARPRVELARLSRPARPRAVMAPRRASLRRRGQVLGEHETEQAVRRLRRFQRLQELDVPLILLVGGATGTGKSTITTEVAHRLGITRVTSTDFVRQTMRAFFSEAFMPPPLLELRGGHRGRRPGEDPREASCAASSTRRGTSSSASGGVERALTEGHSMALEGVHLVPGLVPATMKARSCRTA